jgi:outer membrane protein OmpA-like peptidoglycan-associated protein
VKLLIATLAFISLSTQTFAYDLSHKFGVGGTAGFPIPVFGNAFNSVNNAKWDASLYGRYHFNSSLGLDVGVSHDAFKGSSTKFNNVNFLGFYRLAGAADLSPIVGAGIALTQVKNYDPKSLKLSLLARLGLEYGLSENFSIAGLVDYQYVSKILGNMPHSRAHIVNPQLALTWYFGGEAKKAVVAAPIVQEVVKEVVQEKAPLKEEGLKITQNNGNDEISIEIEFDSDKAIIAPSYDDHLNLVASVFKKHPELKAEIQGYTDNTGSHALNKRLSHQRAHAVRDYLIKLGVEKNRLTAKGFGAENPIADNSTAEGKHKNRRVIAVVK